MTPSKPHKPSEPLFPHLQMEITVLNCRAGEDQGSDSEAGVWVVATLMEEAEEKKLTFIKYLLFAGCCTYAFFIEFVKLGAELRWRKQIGHVSDS